MPIREQDQLLINLILSDSPTQGDLDSFLSNWDLEVEGANNGLLLALFKQRHPELVFNQYVGPRLDGLIRYFRFMEVKFMVELKRFYREMTSIGIHFMLLGDMALRLMMPDTPRSIRQIEVGVPKKYVRKVKPHASEMISVVPLDEAYFAQSRTLSVGEIQIQVLEIEGMIYRLLLGLEYGVNMLDYFRSLPQTVLEINEMIRIGGAFDWSITRDLIIREKTGPRVHDAIECYSSLVQDRLEDFSTGTFSQKESIDNINRCKYIRDVLIPCRTTRHEYSFSKLISTPTCIFQWLAVRVKFKCIKLLYSLKWKSRKQ